ncbi:hypothetical protein EVAR_5771_1 [Eumeta japonica]|uniref:Uncharacterized protein n=1 Tax=Eumeta variegata TaxID=151549 RepID=A0A4C1T4K3_EUMVA|nr:hypothetical protein EVAR_5771_1 [Eumeta japonica]
MELSELINENDFDDEPPTLTPSFSSSPTDPRSGSRTKSHVKRTVPRRPLAESAARSPRLDPNKITRKPEAMRYAALTLILSNTTSYLRPRHRSAASRQRLVLKKSIDNHVNRDRLEFVEFFSYELTDKSFMMRVPCCG